MPSDDNNLNLRLLAESIGQLDDGLRTSGVEDPLEREQLIYLFLLLGRAAHEAPGVSVEPEPRP